MNAAELRHSGLPVVERRIQQFVDDPLGTMSDISRNQGDLSAMVDGDRHLVFAFGASNNRQVLTRSDVFHSSFFAIRGPRNSAQRRLTCGLLSMNGTLHSRQRRIVKSAFDKRTIPHYVDGIVNLCHEMMTDWIPGQIRDMSAEMTSLMLGISSTMLFGMDHPDEAVETGELMEDWVRMNHMLGGNAFASCPEFFPQYQGLLALAEQIEQRIAVMISRRRERSLRNNDIVSLLLRAQADGQPISDEQIIGQTALIFAASHMTTAHTLTWMLFLLAEHPDIAKRIRSRWDKTISGVTVSSQLSADFSCILERTIRESIRIMPASSYSQRICQQDFEIGDATIPAGSIVIFSPFITQRNASVYPQPGRFDPDRWLTCSPDAYDYIPFGGGARLCLGAPLAATIIRLVVPAILWHTGLTTVPGSSVDAQVLSTMCSPARGLPLMLTDPDNYVLPAPVRGNINSLIELPAAGSARKAA